METNNKIKFPFSVRTFAFRVLLLGAHTGWISKSEGLCFLCSLLRSAKLPRTFNLKWACVTWMGLATVERLTDDIFFVMLVIFDDFRLLTSEKHSVKVSESKSQFWACYAPLKTSSDSSFGRLRVPCESGTSARDDIDTVWPPQTWIFKWNKNFATLCSFLGKILAFNFAKIPIEWK